MSTRKNPRQSERSGRSTKAPRKSGSLSIVAAASQSAGAAQGLDQREVRLFKSLDLDNDDRVLCSDLEKMLVQVGLSPDDLRLRESMLALEAHRREQDAQREEAPEPAIPQESFCTAIRHNILLIERALQGQMVIPDFTDFCREIERIHAATAANRSGKAADYIPQLDLKGPELDRFGVGICTVDGQRAAFGDSGTFFSLQSTCKPINYCLALEEHGAAEVHAYIGHEPSGACFNELTLDKQNRPHNPMINAGAIMSSALISLREKRRLAGQGGLDARGWAGARFDAVMACWQALCGGEKPRFSTPVYLSERQTADRNFALAYFMREKDAFPEDAELQDVLDFYFQCCAIEMNAEMMSVVAATLANGGICPISGVRVFRTETVQRCLAMMSSCGMYDFSGEFAFTIGLPAKSGVCGGIMIVIPNVMGLCTWSPRLDAHGNSVRGVEFCRRLVETFNFHNYDTLTDASAKKDPRISGTRRQATRVNELIWAASKGDLGAIQDQLLRGAELGCADYDLRTPLHLAAAENQAEVVGFYVREQARSPAGVDLSPKDRWGGTPLDDAYLQGHREVIALLEGAGARRGAPSLPGNADLPPLAQRLQAEASTTAELIWAASAGDLTTICRLVAKGVPLDIADYDLRTPLHLAAAEGHLKVVEYFIAQGIALEPRDRWGNTPLDDALRHGRDAVAERLRGTCERRRSDAPGNSEGRTAMASR
ncbi:MAG: glutaminase A [Kiloniellales bacterium]|nr:glutaminase A [Kiloniellales bacterium]